MSNEVFCMSEYYCSCQKRGLLFREGLQGVSCHWKILCISVELGMTWKTKDDRGNVAVGD